jgi:hypothetical protein
MSAELSRVRSYGTAEKSHGPISGAFGRLGAAVIHVIGGLRSGLDQRFEQENRVQQ